jgi:hypothetical protein
MSNPFQYYNSTANRRHLPPNSTTLIGYNGDEANHQNDLSDFRNLPSVSLLKAPTYHNGHPEISDSRRRIVYSQYYQSYRIPTRVEMMFDMTLEKLL